MNTHIKILIDKTIGLPAGYILNRVVRLAGFLLRIDHSLDKPFKTIAIAKFVGLGSIIQSTPLLQTLRRKYPTARILFVTTQGNRAYLEKLNCVDEVLCLNDKNIFTLAKSIVNLTVTLWKRKVEVYLDLEIYSNFSSLITTFSLARNRMGFYLRSSNYRMGIYTHMMFYNLNAPVSQVYLQFARLLGCTEIVASLAAIETENLSVSLGKKLNGLKINQKYFIVNPNASDLRIERRWEKAKFVELLNYLVENYLDYQIVLIGAKNEAEYVSEIFSALKPTNQVINAAGRTTLFELFSLVRHASLMLTNDSGPMHIAFSFNTLTVALFGPCDPHQYGQAHNCHTVYKNVYCSPCVHEFAIPPCKGDNQCMQQIAAREVISIIEKAMLSQKNDAIINESKIMYISELEGKVLGVVRR